MIQQLLDGMRYWSMVLVFLIMSNKPISMLVGECHLDGDCQHIPESVCCDRAEPLSISKFISGQSFRCGLE